MSILKNKTLTKIIAMICIFLTLINFGLTNKVYAENEITHPMRVVTSTIRATNGVLVPVRTDGPVLKSHIFDVMKKINSAKCVLPVKLGDVIIANIDGDANLIATKTVE